MRAALMFSIFISTEQRLLVSSAALIVTRAVAKFRVSWSCQLTEHSNHMKNGSTKQQNNDDSKIEQLEKKIEEPVKKYVGFFRIDEDRQKKISEDIKERSKPNLDYVVLTVCSTIIVALGLITDNAAVVIGGMIIAPLIWPFLALALAIDLIVVLMALAGSHFLEGPDFAFDRVKRHSAQQIREVSLDNSETFGTALSSNIARYRQAITYRLDLARVLADYEVAREKAAVTLKRGPEKRSPEMRRPKKRWMPRISLPMNIRTRLAGWIDGEGRLKSEAAPVAELDESAPTEEKKREPIVI